MYIPRMIKEKDLRSLAVSGSRISQQISLQFVPPATFCVCGTFGNIFRNVDTVKQGRSEPRAKKAKVNWSPSLLPRLSVFISRRDLGARKTGTGVMGSCQELQLVREEVARSRLTVNSVKHCEVSDGSRGDARGARAPTLFWVKNGEPTGSVNQNRALHFNRSGT